MASHVRWKHIWAIALISMAIQCLVCGLPIQERDAEATGWYGNKK